MKKTLFMLLTMMGTLTALADNTTYPYLIVETTAGTTTAIDVSSAAVPLTFSGTTLKVGDKTFTLTDLSKMYFSTSNETTGISEITTADLDEVTDIYDLQGRKVSKDQMRRGIYVIKTNKGTFKVNVK